MTERPPQPSRGTWYRGTCTLACARTSTYTHTQRAPAHARVCQYICTHAHSSCTLVRAHTSAHNPSCTYTHGCMHTCTPSIAHVHTHGRTHTCAYTQHAPAHSCANTCTWACPSHTHSSCTHLHTHTLRGHAHRAHTYSHAYTHACTQPLCVPEAGSPGTFPFQGHLAHRVSVCVAPEGQGCPGTWCPPEEWMLRNGLICNRRHGNVGSLCEERVRWPNEGAR